MRRWGFAGLLLAALVLVLAASSASAAVTPLWFECVKNKTSGKLEKGCAKEGGKGGYEARPGLGGSGAFVANGNDALLKTVGGHELTCADFKLEGERVLPDLLRNVTLGLKVCSPTGYPNSKCFVNEEDARPKNSVIESEPLSGELGYISRSPLKVGFKLSNQADPGGVLISNITCAAGFESLWRGSFVAELVGAVNVASAKAHVSYALGSYLGEVSPGYTPEVNPPLEGEEAGGLIEESRKRVSKETFGNPLPSGFQTNLKVHGSIMVAG